MPTENITIRERLILHLSRFPEYGPEEIYNVPFDLTQDGIASVLGISRAHASLELKKLRESEKVSEWLAHIKSSGTKRKAYCLMPDGIKEAKLLKDRLTSEGISVEGLLDMKRCDPSVKWDSLSPEDRETFGLACTFREPILRKTIPDTNTGIIPSDFEGYITISDEVRIKYLKMATDESIKRWHSRAADWYIDNVSDEQEKLFHLCSSNRDIEAAKLLIRNAENFLEDPNEDLMEIVKKMRVPPKYNETVLEIRSKLAVECQDGMDALYCADRLEEYGQTVGPIILRSEVDILKGHPEKAYDRAISKYGLDRTPSLALVIAKSLFKMKRYKDAEDFLSDAIRSFNESGDVAHMDRIMVLRAGIAYNLGKNDDCASYLNKALNYCKDDDYRSRIKKMVSDVKNGRGAIDFL